MNIPRPSPLPYLALFGCVLAVAFSPVFVRLAEVGPYASAFWRTALALPILWGWMRVAERGQPAGRTPRVPLSKVTALAGLCFTGDLLCWHTALVRTTVANATFFATMAPLWVVVFGWLLFRERVSRATVAGLALCIVGGFGLVAQSLRVGGGHIAGDALGVATGAFYGLYFMAVSAARKDTGAARVTFELTAVATAMLLGVALAVEPTLLPATAAGWAALLALAWVSHAAGQGLLSVALGRLPTVFAALVILIQPILAALLAWAILAEAVSALQGFGAAAILAGIWIARPR